VNGANAMAQGRLLTVDAAAERLSTSPRFIRRLIAERRIEFVKVGRHVRISESALAEFVDAGRVEPLTAADIRHSIRGVALWLTKMGIVVSATSACVNLAATRSAIRGRTGGCVQGRRRTSARGPRTGRSC
jgi:excisionase family DNA binding protein